MNWNDGTEAYNLRAKIQKLEQELRQVKDKKFAALQRARDAEAALKMALDDLQGLALSREEWKDRVIDALIVTWAYKAEHENDPKLAVNDLIISEIRMATDPQISQHMHDALVNAFDAGAKFALGGKPLTQEQARVEFIRRYIESQEKK